MVGFVLLQTLVEAVGARLLHSMARAGIVPMRMRMMRMMIKRVRAGLLVEKEGEGISA